MYFRNLVEALHPTDSAPKVVLLIDEYDAPVTRNIHDLKTAQANARTISEFLATLKVSDVSKHIRFSFITGLTRYALTAMDSGANQLIDISSNPDFEGICGFTLKEFDSLFGDRLEETLRVLKKKKEIEPSAGPEELRREILEWYDGYSWGGDSRILNPWSILNFFQDRKFDSYWIQSGRPSHLTAMIRERPLDFLMPQLESYSSEMLRKSELTSLEPAPVLFHSGYLTVASVSKVRETIQGFTKKKAFERYSLKTPNAEVSSSYYKECFKDVLGLKDGNVLKTKGEALGRALLDKDESAVGRIFQDYFVTIPFYERPEKEKYFHAFVHLIFSALGFTVLSELSGAVNRLDLCVKSSDEEWVVIELKYCAVERKPTPEEKEKALASIAMSKLPQKTRDESLADAVRKKLTFKKTSQVLRKTGRMDLSLDEENMLLAEAAITQLSDSEYQRALASAAEKRLLPAELEKELAQMTASRKSALPDEEVERILSKAVDQALKDIETRDYRSLIKPFAGKISAMGMAVFKYGSKVKAAFAPDGRSPLTQPKRSAKKG
jgi:hypothetical protein